MSGLSAVLCGKDRAGVPAKSVEAVCINSAKLDFLIKSS
jgi:hypothetical protein